MSSKNNRLNNYDTNLPSSFLNRRGVEICWGRLACQHLITSEFKLTFVDIAILELLAKLSILCEPDLLVSYPTLNAHRERIESMPCFETYLIKRARTFF